MNKQNNFKKFLINFWFFIILLFPILFFTIKFLKNVYISNFLLNISVHFYLLIFFVLIFIEYTIFFKLFFFIKNKIESKSKRHLFVLATSILILLFSFLIIHNFLIKPPKINPVELSCGEEFNNVYRDVLAENNINYFLTKEYKINLKYDGDKASPFKYACKSFDDKIWEINFQNDIWASDVFLSVLHIFFGITQLDNLPDKLANSYSFFVVFSQNIKDQEILNSVDKNLFKKEQENIIIERAPRLIQTQPNSIMKEENSTILNGFYINKNNCIATNGENNDCQLIIKENGIEEVVVNNLKRDIKLINDFVNQKSPVGNEVYSAIKIKGSYNDNVYLGVHFTEGDGSTLLLKYNIKNGVAEKIDPPFNVSDFWERGSWLDEPGNCVLLGIHKNIPVMGVIKNNEVWVYNIETKNFNKYIVNDAENCYYYTNLNVGWDDKDLAIWIDGNKIKLEKNY